MNSTAFAIILGIVVVCFVISSYRMKAAAKAFQQPSNPPSFDSDEHYMGGALTDGLDDQKAASSVKHGDDDADGGDD